MKFGVAIWPGEPAELAQNARLAEEQGFDYIGVPESQSLARELYVSLSVVAQATSKPHIGPTVTNPLTRHPAVSAAAIASINDQRYRTEAFLPHSGASPSGEGEGFKVTPLFGAHAQRVFVS